MITMVCPVKKTKIMSTGFSVQTLFDEADACPGNLSIDNDQPVGTFTFDQFSKQATYAGLSDVKSISVYNLAGQEVLNLNGDSNGIIDLSSLNKGMHIVKLVHAQGILTRKIVIG